MSPLINHLRLFFKYLQRDRILANFLGLEKSDVKAYLREADEIARTMLSLTETANLGIMLSQLRGPIVYVLIRALKSSVMVETSVERALLWQNLGF